MSVMETSLLGKTPRVSNWHHELNEIYNSNNLIKG